MKKLITAILMIGALGVLSKPAPADAAATNAGDCLTDAISSCDTDFSSDTETIIGVRGWCYPIRWGICALVDAE